MLGQAHL